MQRCLCTTRYTCTVGLQRCTLNVFLFTRRRRRLFLSTCTRTCTIVVLGNRMWINTFVGTFVLSYFRTRVHVHYVHKGIQGTMYEGMILYFISKKINLLIYLLYNKCTVRVRCTTVHAALSQHDLKFHAAPKASNLARGRKRR